MQLNEISIKTSICFSTQMKRWKSLNHYRIRENIFEGDKIVQCYFSTVFVVWEQEEENKIGRIEKLFKLIEIVWKIQTVQLFCK